MELLKYLNENKEISKKSEFNIIKNMTYEEILNAYKLILPVITFFEKAYAGPEYIGYLKHK